MAPVWLVQQVEQRKNLQIKCIKPVQYFSYKISNCTSCDYTNAHREKSANTSTFSCNCISGYQEDGNGNCKISCNYTCATCNLIFQNSKS
jgi:hypothetical protein